MPAVRSWALGTEARSRALLSEGKAAESLYLEAIERLVAPASDGTRPRQSPLRRMAAPRTQTAGRARAAAGRIPDVHDDGHGGVHRSRSARAAGHGRAARRRTLETSGHLTAQEAQIARLAGDGQTNPEIAARLFLSPRTVEWHLRKVFAKLDISSRNQLSRILLDGAPRRISEGDGGMLSPAIETQVADA